ncbi:hypothetical protein Nepgr_010111 [Nepenthes gracilis]|uniref:PGG domain-containing protein n=1 Tax=Nepenthes gracilis TaxID=150966 RepID=A0AAD3SCG1_NEPGR|nr:hypothetical protein Nepgr_010111 [Nepenthes gracilis]
MERYLAGELSAAASEGNSGFLDKTQAPESVKELPEESYFLSCTGNTDDSILCIAASNGHVEFIVRHRGNSRQPVLLICQNSSKGDTPLHIAAKLPLLLLMVAEEGGVTAPWGAQNSGGDTPLHKVLRNKHQELVMYLLEEDHELASCINNERTVKIQLKKRPELIKTADNQKKTAQHYAAERGPKWHIELLLKKDRSCAYLLDAEGFTPLPKAPILGHLQAAHTILLYSPQSIAIFDNKSRNLLHAVKLESYQDGIELVKLPAITEHVNEPDQEGNSPPHLAVKDCDHVKANVLLSNRSIEANIKNGDVIAAIPAAISFAVVFAMPGGLDPQGNAILARKTLFKVSILSNESAMCSCMLVLLTVLWAKPIAQRAVNVRVIEIVLEKVEEVGNDKFAVVRSHCTLPEDLQMAHVIHGQRCRRSVLLHNLRQVASEALLGASNAKILRLISVSLLDRYNSRDT